MNIEQLTKTIKSTNKRAILGELKRLGYINCAKDKEMRHINMCDIANAIHVLSTETFATKNSKYEFYGDICTNVIGLEGYEFIIISINKVYRDKDLSFPYKIFTFAKKVKV